MINDSSVTVDAAMDIKCESKTQEDFVRVIDIDKLEVGDIILTTSEESISTLIKTVTDSDISHAMVYLGGGSVVDSTGDGVHARNLQKMPYPESCAIYVLRMNEALTEKQFEKIEIYARSNIGTGYSMGEAGLSIFDVESGGSRKQFCSRLVARAFEEAGIRLVKNPNYCTPDDLKQSSLLSFVDGVIQSISMADFRSRGKDSVQEMRDVTKALLSEIRKIAPNVESINDINDFLIGNSKMDGEIAQIFVKSGYLDLWRNDEALYPWRYDLLKIVDFYESGNKRLELIKYARESVAHIEEGGFDHWIVCARGYFYAYKYYGFETFKLLAELYSNLESQLNRRLLCAKYVVEQAKKDVSASM
ncbi:hypothetical protein CEK28_04780 [Xenophilus sp. AP218F]|nr:hypothetical protein CEK28_04780 [Xenophilus sp. AP218F]